MPLSLMYPQADIPVLQLSLPSRLGPALQSRVGQALRQLRGEGVLLIGSGSITHNLGELDWHAGPEAIAPWAREFRDWMVEKLQADDEAALRLPPAGALGGAQPPQRRAPAALFFARGAGSGMRVEHSGFTLGSLGMDIYRFD
ncbi:class III extradiol ring-cleavage dioxygenase [Pseudomonas aeruginosa]|nr:class III extradiol ring-cleavage dioxygenase [Pseudomonas aeruginosa]